MSTYIIAGDSWGCGEWNIDSNAITHTGLEQYLVDEGHQVFNLSKGATSNLDSVKRITAWMSRHTDVPVDGIFVFQTEYNRDFKHDIAQKNYNINDWDVKNLTDISDRWIARFYMRLSEIAQEKNCKVFLIGGASDTLWFDDMEQDYPGCNIACQSVTNLLINNNHKIDVPVLSWYVKAAQSFIEKAKSCGIGAEEIIQHIDQGIERESLLAENPELFFPDGSHPNRIGHQILFNFLKQEKFIV